VVLRLVSRVKCFGVGLGPLVILHAISGLGLPLPPQFFTVPARAPRAQSSPVRSLVGPPLASIPVAGARLSSVVSSHCSRLGLFCLILDFPSAMLEPLD
jgi:hypothetical protein